MGTVASGLEAATAASDALATVLRGVRLAPDPAAVWLVCAEGPARLRTRRDIIAVSLPGCVRALPLSGYLELAIAGATSVHLVPGPCCAGQAEPEAVTDARELVGRHGLATELSAQPPAQPRFGRSHPVVAATALPLPRRAVLAPWLLTRLPARARDERDRLLDAFRALGEPVPAAPAAPAELASAPPDALLLAASGCTACGVCVKACPPRALSLEPVGSGQALREDVALCTACGDCLRLCPQDALSSRGAATWGDVRDRTVLTLATVPMAAPCSRCGAPLSEGAGHDGLCPVCAYRKAHPFGSAMPPGAAR